MRFIDCSVAEAIFCEPPCSGVLVEATYQRYFQAFVVVIAAVDNDRCARQQEIRLVGCNKRTRWPQCG